MCIYTWPPLHEVFWNYEVVVFQIPTVIPPYLVSVAIFTLKLVLLTNLYLSFIWIFLVPPYFFSPYPYPFIVEVLSHFHPISTYSPGAKRCPPGLQPHSLTTNLSHTSLHPTPCACVWHRSCDCLPPPPPR